jgi:membrane-bound metal-dependent hydrolase YbcI (DUF457 family)
MFAAVLLGMGLLGKVPPEFIIFLWLFSFLPDLDVFLGPLQKIRRMYFLSHKAASHSIPIGVIVTSIFSVIFWLIIPDFPFLMAWLGGILGYSIHSFLDYFTASKIPIFYPFSKKEFRLIADRAINPILCMFSIVSMLYFIHIFNAGADVHTLRMHWYFYLAFYISYFGFKAALRFNVQRKLPKGYIFIPGILPLFYTIYENDKSEKEIIHRLVKRRLFSSQKKVLIEKIYNLNSEELEYFKMAKEISKDYRFFYKWEALIPFFRKNDERFNVILVLAEGYTNGTSYSLSVIFDRKSKKVIDKRERFYSIKKWEKPLL